ncbi:hypothetical protein QFZ79_000773 [Arthrobacter sp. V4I6]|nr:hypothetical protein [Arthrobacter sp. V1I7]MDQ0852662.1 hypothetical protein [Arthrobacter sp. V4I6]
MPWDMIAAVVGGLLLILRLAGLGAPRQGGNAST